MAEKNKNDSVKEITDKLEQGLKELFDSERFKTYLNTMSKFYNYSFNNTLLIAMQKPDATLVAGFQSWQKNFERHVNKGEKGIKIMAPAPYKKKQEMEVIDQKTGRTVLGEDGKPKTEEVEITIPAFKPVTVFDVSQTDGKPIPDLGVAELMTSVEDFKYFMKALERVAPVPIEYMDIASGAKGYFSPSEQKIAIQKDMSESQTVKTAVHETAHSLLHDKDHVRVEGIDDSEKKTRSTKEVEAESVAYTVCQHFGIDTSEYSFGYVAGWSSGKEMTELKESMDTIRKTASQLITGIEDALKEIKLEREQGKEQNQAYALAQQIDNFMYDFDPYGYQDQVEDRAAQVETIAADLDSGKADYITDYLKEIVQEQDGTPEILAEAQKLIEKVEDYKPLVKVEEQLDSASGRKADMEKTKESKRPSLKKRLEEKKEQVAAQPEKPAPEKVKKNERSIADE